MSDYSVSVDTDSVDRISESVSRLENSMANSLSNMSQMMAQQSSMAQQMNSFSGYMTPAVDDSFTRSMANMSNTMAANAYASANMMAGGIQSMGYSMGSYGWAPPSSVGFGGNTPTAPGGFFSGLWNMSGLGSQPINMSPTEYNQLGFEQLTKGASRGLLSAGGYLGSFLTSAAISDVAYMAQGGSFKESTLGTTYDVVKQLAGVTADGLPGAWSLAKSLTSGAFNLATTLGPSMMVGMAAAGIGGAIYSGMQNNWDIQDDLQSTSFRYFRGNQGRGFNRSQRQEIANSVQEMGINEMTSSGDFSTENLQQLMKMPQFSSYMSGTRDVDDFKKRFKGLVDSVKEVALALNENFEHASATVMELKRMGIGDPSQVARTADMIRGASLSTGFTSQEVTGFISNVGRMFNGTSISQGVAAPIVTQSMSMLQAARTEGAIDPTIIANMGGVQGLTQQVTSTVAGLAVNDSVLKSLFQQAFNKDTGGLNKDVIEKFLRGDQSVIETSVAGAANVIMPGDMVKFQRAFPKLIEQAGDKLVPLVFSRARQMSQEFTKIGLSEDDAMYEAFNQMTGSNQAMTQTFMGMYKAGSGGAIDMMMQQRESRKRRAELEEYEKYSIGGRLGRAWERVKETAASPARDIANWVDNSLESLNDSLAGVTRYQASSTLKSKEEAEYWYLRSSSMLNADTINDRITDRALSASKFDRYRRVEPVHMTENISSITQLTPSIASNNIVNYWTPASNKSIENVYTSSSTESRDSAGEPPDHSTARPDPTARPEPYKPQFTSDSLRKPPDHSTARPDPTARPEPYKPQFTSDSLRKPPGSAHPVSGHSSSQPLIVPEQPDAAYSVSGHSSSQPLIVPEQPDAAYSVSGHYSSQPLIVPEQSSPTINVLAAKASVQPVGPVAEGPGYVLSAHLSKYALRSEMFNSLTGYTNTMEGKTNDQLYSRIFSGDPVAGRSKEGLETLKSSIEAAARLGSARSEQEKEAALEGASNAYMTLVGAQSVAGRQTSVKETQDTLRQLLANAGMSNDDMGRMAEILNPKRELRNAALRDKARRLESADDNEPLVNRVFNAIFDREEPKHAASMLGSTLSGASTTGSTPIVGLRIGQAALETDLQAVRMGVETANLVEGEGAKVLTNRGAMLGRLGNAEQAATYRYAYKQTGGLFSMRGLKSFGLGSIKSLGVSMLGHAATDYATDTLGLSEGMEYAMHGAVEGASLGMFFGPWGTLIGAGAGAALGVAGNYLGLWGRPKNINNFDARTASMHSGFMNRAYHSAISDYEKSEDFKSDRDRLRDTIDRENMGRGSDSIMTSAERAAELERRMEARKEEVGTGAWTRIAEDNLSRSARALSGANLSGLEAEQARVLRSSAKSADGTRVMVNEDALSAAIKEAGVTGTTDRLMTGEGVGGLRIDRNTWAQTLTAEQLGVMTSAERQWAKDDILKTSPKLSAGDAERYVAEREMAHIEELKKLQETSPEQYEKARQARISELSNAGSSAKLTDEEWRSGYSGGGVNGKAPVEVTGGRGAAASLITDVVNKRLTDEQKERAAAKDAETNNITTVRSIKEAHEINNRLEKAIKDSIKNASLDTDSNLNGVISKIAADAIRNMETTTDANYTVDKAIKQAVGNAIQRKELKESERKKAETDVLAIVSGTAQTSEGNKRLASDTKYASRIDDIRDRTKNATKSNYRSVRAQMAREGKSVDTGVGTNVGLNYGDTRVLNVEGQRFNIRASVKDADVRIFRYKDKDGGMHISVASSDADYESQSKRLQEQGATVYEAANVGGFNETNGNGLAQFERSQANIGFNDLNNLGAAVAKVNNEDYTNKAIDYLSSFKNSTESAYAKDYYGSRNATDFEKSMGNVLKGIKSGEIKDADISKLGTPLSMAAKSYKDIAGLGSDLAKKQAEVTKEGFANILQNRYKGLDPTYINAMTNEVFGNNNSMGSESAFKNLADSSTYAKIAHIGITSGAAVENGEQFVSPGESHKSPKEIQTMQQWAQSMTDMVTAISALHKQVVK